MSDALPPKFDRLMVTAWVELDGKRYSIVEYVDAQYWAYPEAREGAIRTLKAKLVMGLIDHLDPMVEVRHQ